MAEPIALLDVNVLIAWVDPQHVHHDSSHSWFQAHGCHGWTTCPLTQNALLRILGNPRYPNSPGGPVVVMSLLQKLLAHPSHVFWSDVCPGMPLASLRQKHFFTTGRSRMPTCLRWQFITEEYLSALIGV